MTFRNVFFVVTLLVMTGPIQSCAGASEHDMTGQVEQTDDITTLLESPKKARNYDYCQWAFVQGGTTISLPDFKTMLDHDKITMSPENYSATALVDAGTRISQNSKSQKFCTKIFQKGAKKFDKELKKSLKSHWAKATYEVKEDADIAAVQETLAKHWVEDQAARRVYLSSRTDDETGANHWTRRLAAAQTSQADERSTQYMKAVLSEYDWIDIHRFGKRVSMAAWLMVQHADDDVELQSLALKRMESYLENGGVDKGDYAFLWDRVAVNSGREQRYGTQPTWECTSDGRLTLQPLEDPENVNKRREAMGLDTVEEGLAKMTKSVCG